MKSYVGYTQLWRLQSSYWSEGASIGEKHAPGPGNQQATSRKGPQEKRIGRRLKCLESPLGPVGLVEKKHKSVHLYHAR